MFAAALCTTVKTRKCPLTDTHTQWAAAAAAKSLQSCPTLCDPIAGSPPGSPVPGILQARTLEWVAISFSNAWKWSLSVMSDSSRPHGLQPTRLLHPWDFPGKSTGVGCHCLLHVTVLGKIYYWPLAVIIPEYKITKQLDEMISPFKKKTTLSDLCRNMWHLWSAGDVYYN